VFMVRVGQWRMKMFASALSVREYAPEVELRYWEESARQMVIAKVKSGVVRCWLLDRWGCG
jgi:hypothetical protein